MCFGFYCSTNVKSCMHQKPSRNIREPSLNMNLQYMFLAEDYIFVTANDPMEQGAPVTPTAHPTVLLIAVCVK
jgi:hypothetical protein